MQQRAISQGILCLTFILYYFPFQTSCNRNKNSFPFTIHILHNVTIRVYVSNSRERKKLPITISFYFMLITFYSSCFAYNHIPSSILLPTITIKSIKQATIKTKMVILLSICIYMCILWLEMLLFYIPSKAKIATEQRNENEKKNRQQLYGKKNECWGKKWRKSHTTIKPKVIVLHYQVYLDASYVWKI